MKRLLIALVATLAGCAITPQEMMDAGQRTDFKSAKAPREVANCIERNASEIKWGLAAVSHPARVRDGRVPGAFEVVYSADMGTLAIAEIRPAPPGSAFSIWRSQDDPWPLRGQGTLDEQMARGC